GNIADLFVAAGSRIPVCPHHWREMQIALMEKEQSMATKVNATKGKPREGEEVSDGYHPYNLTLQPYDHDKLKELIGHAVRLGIQFHVGGIPFGASYDRALWQNFNVESSLPRAS